MRKLPVRTLTFAVLVLLAACDSIAPQAPTLTPTRTLTGATLEPSPTRFILPPTVWSEDVYSQPGVNNPTAAALPADAELPPLRTTPVPGADVATGASRVQMTLPDQTTVLGDLYEPFGVVAASPLADPVYGRVPGVLLLGPAGTSWGALPGRLREAGFTAMILELGDWSSANNMVTILHSFSNTGTVDPARIAVIGSQQGADLALIGCAIDLLCDTLVMLSPTNRDTGLNVLQDYNPRPLLLAASEADSTAYIAAYDLSLAARGEVVLQAYDDAGSGTELLANQPDLIGIIIGWLEQYLAPI